MRFCEFGHQQQGYLQETMDWTEWGGSSGRCLTSGKRRSEGNRRQRKKLKSELKLYGDEGQYISLLACQTILRNFVKILVKDLGFPATLETVCRDLWFMFAGTQRILVSSQSSFHASQPSSGDEEGDFEKHFFFSRPSSFPTSQPLSSQSETPYDSGSSQDDTQSQEEVPDGDEAHATQNQRRGRFRIKAYYALVILYVGCLFLKVPILINDLITLCAQNILPYFSSFRKLLSEELATKLPKSYLPGFTSRFLPKQSKLTKCIAHFVHHVEAKCGVQVPPIALEGLAFRVMFAWGFPLSFASTLVGYWAAMQVDGDWRKREPEVRLMAAAIQVILSMVMPTEEQGSRRGKMQGVGWARYPEFVHFAQTQPAAFASFYQQYLRPEKSTPASELLQHLLPASNSPSPTTSFGWLTRDFDKFKHVPLHFPHVKKAMAIFAGIEPDRLEFPTKRFAKVTWNSAFLKEK